MLEKAVMLWLGLAFFVSAFAGAVPPSDDAVAARLSRCMQEEVTFVSLASRINLNTASVEQLLHKVAGIGQKRAEAIVAYRKAHGPFLQWQDLAKVKGLGGRFVSSHLPDLEKHFALG